MLDLYLRDLERRARWTLASREVDALLADAREHLAASIQARVELGEKMEVAEQEAVGAFGCAQDLIRAANAFHRARFQGVFLAGTTTAGLGWGFALLASPMLDRVVVVIAGGVFFTMLGCFVESSKVRRPLAPVLGATAVFWLALNLTCAWWVRDYSIEDWFQPHLDGLVDLLHTALWSTVSSTAFCAYLLHAYRMARPAPARRGHA